MTPRERQSLSELYECYAARAREDYLKHWNAGVDVSDHPWIKWQAIARFLGKRTHTEEEEREVERGVRRFRL